MSYKDVLKVFKLERELSDDETALLNTLRDMTDAEREMTVEAFGGSMGKVGKGAVSRSLKKLKQCDICGISKRAAHHRDVNHPDYHEFDAGGQAGTEKKSKRALELAEKLPKPLGQGVKADEYEDAGDELCAKCGGDGDNNVHHKRTDPDYHPFVSSSSAHPARDQSSTSGDEVSSETDLEDVSVAAGG